jgi:hypothetical protein
MQDHAFRRSNVTRLDGAIRRCIAVQRFGLMTRHPRRSTISVSRFVGGQYGQPCSVFGRHPDRQCHCPCDLDVVHRLAPDARRPRRLVVTPQLLGRAGVNGPGDHASRCPPPCEIAGTSPCSNRASRFVLCPWRASCQKSHSDFVVGRPTNCDRVGEPHRTTSKRSIAIRRLP